MGASANVDYVGRFAPSPSGPLHFGSVVAATASYLQARNQGGRWLVRIDDIDPPREQLGASSLILESLASLGLEWDGPVVYQSTRSAAYDDALEKLTTGGLTFACACSRKQIGGGPYPGTCRNGIPSGLSRRSLRLRVGATRIAFNDQLQGYQGQNLAQDVGDFIVMRAAGLYAYHLAVVVDDALARVTEIVRGVDLLHSTPRQIYLQRLLGFATPKYLHIPVVLDRHGAKLSKQTYAKPIDPQQASAILFEVLRFLDQSPPAEIRGSQPTEILSWAAGRWDVAAIGKQSRRHHAPD